MGDFRERRHSQVKVAGTIVIDWPGSANTKTAYTEVISSTPFDCDHVVIDLNGHSISGGSSANPYGCLVDFAVGAAGSEVVIASNLLASKADAAFYWFARYDLPISISAGQRLSCRLQAGYTTHYAIQISPMLYSSSFTNSSGLTMVEAIGASTGDSGGTGIGGGSSAWVQLTAATTKDYEGFLLGIACTDSAAISAYGYTIDLAVGAGGSEIVILEDFPIKQDGVDENITPQTTPYIPLCVPSGTRIAARSNSLETLDVVFYGVR